MQLHAEDHSQKHGHTRHLGYLGTQPGHVGLLSSQQVGTWRGSLCDCTQSITIQLRLQSGAEIYVLPCGRSLCLALAPA